MESKLKELRKIVIWLKTIAYLLADSTIYSTRMKGMLEKAEKKGKALK